MIVGAIKGAINRGWGVAVRRGVVVRRGVAVRRVRDIKVNGDRGFKLNIYT